MRLSDLPELQAEGSAVLFVEDEEKVIFVYCRIDLLRDTVMIGIPVSQMLY